MHAKRSDATNGGASEITSSEIWIVRDSSPFAVTHLVQKTSARAKVYNENYRVNRAARCRFEYRVFILVFYYREVRH